MARAFIHITTNGNALPGVTTIQELGGEDLFAHTEIWSFYHEMSRQTESGSAALAGQTINGPFSFVKNFDSISPLLMNALTQGHNVDAQIKIFELNIEDSGSMVLARRITLGQGRLVDLRKEMVAGQGQTAPTIERVSIVANIIRLESLTNPNTAAEFNWTQVA